MERTGDFVVTISAHSSAIVEDPAEDVQPVVDAVHLLLCYAFDNVSIQIEYENK